jgi:hypothetical protein
MSAPAQMSLLDDPAEVRDQVDAALELIQADPIHADDRRAIVAAIAAEVDQTGTVDANRLRRRLTGRQGLTVYPAVIGSVVSTLARRGLLRADGWTQNDDVNGRNRGKPLRVWRGDASVLNAAITAQVQ